MVRGWENDDEEEKRLEGPINAEWMRWHPTGITPFDEMISSLYSLI